MKYDQLENCIGWKNIFPTSNRSNGFANLSGSVPNRMSRLKQLIREWVSKPRALDSLALHSRSMEHIHVNPRHHVCVWDLSQIP